MWGARKWAQCVVNLLSGSLQLNLKTGRKLISAEEAWDPIWHRFAQGRVGFFCVLDESGDGRTLHPYKQKIDSFVDKQIPMYLKAFKF